ncbi:MAG: shikimate kinase [Candidatus Kapaibacterium sp.]|nr:MAG: shikimate kinase [Candidatus Kapabacteria bacterium]
MKQAKPSQNLVFIGFRGTGKTTISLECATQRGAERISTDEQVTKRLGMSIADFVQQHGWAEFRRHEHEEICALWEKYPHSSHNNSAAAFVIDCGGGVVENPENMRLLGELGEIVWIHAELDDVLSRLLAEPQAQSTNATQRPLLNAASDMRSDLIANYTRRLPIYEQYAERCINTSTMSIQECCRTILRS